MRRSHSPWRPRPQPPTAGREGSRAAAGLPELLEQHLDALADHVSLPATLLARLGVVPSYYLRYFYEHDAVVAELLNSPSRASQVAQLETTLLEMYRDESLHQKPDLLEQRGGAYYSEAAVALVASLLCDTGDQQVVNVRNGSTLPFLPAEAVIEVPARVGRHGAQPLKVAPVEPLYAGLIAHTSSYEELALDAALRGGRDRVFAALLAHPLVGQVEVAERLTGLLLAHNKEHLSWASPRVAGCPCCSPSTGGNSKTDVALVRADGAVLARGRGPGFEPHLIGADAAVDGLATAVSRALKDAGFPHVSLLAAYLANADLPVEEQRIASALHLRGWSARTTVRNDTFAVLRAGTSAPRGVAVVCGAGINCVGMLPDGRIARFMALGRTTGDWGGGMELAEEVLWWATRYEDGRGPGTALARATAEHFGTSTASDVAVAVHLGELDRERLHELVPVLFRVARDGDLVARSVVERQADEIVVLAVTALAKLDLLDGEADVVLGGGVLAAGDPGLMGRIKALMAKQAPRSRVCVLGAPPIVGAVLLGLDELAGPPGSGGAADPSAEQRVRRLLTPAPSHP